MRLMIFAVAVAMVVSTNSSAQVILNQIDTFESGIANWQNPAGLASVQTGGPAGPSDHFLQLATNGATAGMGALLIGFNQDQWVGNYTVQSVGAIEMDLKNINYVNGGSGMSIRIVFRAGTGGPTEPAYISNAINLFSDGSWHHVVYALIESNFTPVNSPPTFAAMLAGANQDFRILHNPIASEIGAATPPVAAQLGIDNIHAIGVPEPSSLILMGVAGLGSIRFWLRKRRVYAGS